MLSPQAALVYAMVVAAEADHEIAEPEIKLIGDLVNHLPIFRGLDRQRVTELATRCSEQLAGPGGDEAVLGAIRAALSAPLRALAYALVCDVIAVDSRLQRDEMQVLERLRMLLEVDPASARTVEHAARIRFQAA
jgi:uncharacterized tellurite resistance protein B-like protein